ncbi:hypothetical protein MI149_30235 [Mycolicibacterium crocinum]|uniref:Uncharacterized protein n=1 Tax=Mycolicibacterium crocinum TaxID=388459 RepID=A0ABY5TUA0_9MYCO|nr:MULTISPECIES: hypothetical protein [Mycolicibacterium]UVY96044.1 hypothetical protein MI149_30235 [Mycolicibacterium crocinum]
MTGSEPRRLWSVPLPSSSDDDAEPPDTDDPDPPEEDTQVLLW